MFLFMGCIQFCKKEKSPIQPTDTCLNVSSSINKWRGISFESPPQEIDDASFVNIRKVNANSVALIPYAFGVESTGEILYNHPRQWWGEKSPGIDSLIQFARKNNLSILMKPQVWIPNTFTGNFLPENKHLDVFKKTYKEYILYYARIAEYNKAEVFCIGTEFKALAISYPQYWINLIEEIRTEFSGKLTYASNWDEYDQIVFWNKLDYIGIDAYFPLSNLKTPEKDDLVQQWKPIKHKLQQFAAKNSSQILFTEYGYRSVDYTTLKPWEESVSNISNEQAQYNALSALYCSVWNEDWFAGGFLWKWHANTEQATPVSYSVQGKLSEQLLKEFYTLQ